jgi:hypothetical protein
MGSGVIGEFFPIFTPLRSMSRVADFPNSDHSERIGGEYFAGIVIMPPLHSGDGWTGVPRTPNDRRSASRSL